MQGSDAVLHRLKIAEAREAVVAVRMIFDRRSTGVLQNRGNQRARTLRRQKAADVFESDAIWVDAGGITGLLRVVGIGVTR